MSTKDDKSRPDGYPHHLPHFTTVSAFDARRIVQICANNSAVYALSSEGEAWALRRDPNPFVDESKAYSWTRLPNLPQEQQPTKKGNQ